VQNIIDSFPYSEDLESFVTLHNPLSTNVQFAEAVGTFKDPATVVVDLLRLETEEEGFSETIVVNVSSAAKTIVDSFSFSDSAVGFIGSTTKGALGQAIFTTVSGGGTVKYASGGAAVIIKGGGGTVSPNTGEAEVDHATGQGKVN